MYLEEEREELARLDKEAATMVILFPYKTSPLQSTDSSMEIICKKQTKSVCVFLQLCNGLPRL